MRSWLNNLLKNPKKDTGKVLGINLSPEHAAWCLLENAQASPRIHSSEYVEEDTPSPVAALQALIDKGALPKHPCHICLDHRYYSMLLVDAPDVPDQELSDAVKWKVKDLINHDIESVVVDAFRLPEDAYRGRMNMLYVAVMETDVVQGLVNLCDKSGLQLESIGVNELAMSALTEHVAADSDLGAAFLYINGNSGTINLIEQGHLYLTRTIELAKGGGTFSGNLDFQQDPVDNLALDVQRSLDYYESQLGKTGVSAVYLVAADHEHGAWVEGLSERLPISAHLYTVPNALNAEGVRDTGIVAPALGAALAAVPWAKTAKANKSAASGGKHARA